jgi:hypothetical protein
MLFADMIIASPSNLVLFVLGNQAYSLKDIGDIIDSTLLYF